MKTYRNEQTDRHILNY